MANFPVFQFDPKSFPLLTPQQTNPFGGVLADSIAKRLAMAQAQKAETESQYAEKNAMADLLKKELENKSKQQEYEWYVPNIKSEIGYRNAGKGHLGAETNKINSMLPYEIQKAKDTIDASRRSRSLEQLIQDTLSGKEPTMTPNAQQAQQNNNAPSVPQGGNAPSMAMTPNASLPYTPIPNASIPQQNGGENPQEKVINQGSPNLHKIDNLYDNNPLARAALDKMGFKKTQQIKIDKSGNPTIVTRYPSGKITVQSQNNMGDESTPLTTKMISQHQNVVSSVDIAKNVLDKIISLENNEYSRFGGWTSKGAKYKALVKEGLDSVLGAFGLPNTNEGIKSILDQLEIGHGENPEKYRERIKELKGNLLKRQKYSKNLLKKSNTQSTENSEANNDPYDLDKYDNSRE